MGGNAMKHARYIVLIMLALLLTCICAGANAAVILTSGRCGNDMEFVFYNDGRLEISGSGAMYDWDTTEGHYAPWYNGNINEVTEVIISGDVTSIGRFAFYRCPDITQITIPSSVKTIGGGAFFQCTGLKEAFLPGVEQIGASAFFGCTSLEKVNFTLDLTEIGTGAFGMCTELSDVYYEGDDRTDIRIDTGNEALTGLTWHYSTFDGGKCGPDIEWELTADGAMTLTGSGYMAFDTPPWGYLSDRIISVNIGRGIKDICDQAFCGCTELVYVDMSDSLDSIGSYAFTGCTSLERVSRIDYQGTSFTEIGEYAFCNCTSLTEIFPTQTENIGVGAFMNCTSLTKIFMTQSKSVGSYAFAGCTSLKTVRNKYLVDIGDHAFLNCRSLMDMIIPKTETIGNEAFKGCSALEYVTLGSKISRIDSGAFADCESLWNIYYPGDEYAQRNIYIGYNNGMAGDTGSWKFEYQGGGKCGDRVRWFVFDDVLTIAGAGDMYDYDYDHDRMPWYYLSGEIKTIRIFNKITYIGNHAFIGLSYANKAEIEDDVTAVGDHAFQGCQNIREISLKNVTSIGDLAFFGSGLTDILLPEVSYVGEYAFEKCYDLRSVTFMKKAYIGYGAFRHCSSLALIRFCDGITAVDNMAFDECTSLTDVYYSGTEADRALIPIDTYMNGSFTNALWHYGTLAEGSCGDNIRWMIDSDMVLILTGSGATYDWNYRTDVPWYQFRQYITGLSVGKGITTIGRNAFCELNKVQKVSLPSVMYVHDNAFEYCTDLREIDLPCIREIRRYAFYGCVNLRTILAGNDLEHIYDSAFSYIIDLTDIYFAGTEADKASMIIGGYNDALNSVSWHCAGGDDTLVIPSGIREIGSEAFAGTDAVFIMVPWCCETVAENAFDGCPRLRFIINWSNAKITEPDGVYVISG